MGDDIVDEGVDAVVADPCVGVATVAWWVVRDGEARVAVWVLLTAPTVTVAVTALIDTPVMYALTAGCLPLASHWNKTS